MIVLQGAEGHGLLAGRGQTLKDRSGDAQDIVGMFGAAAQGHHGRRQPEAAGTLVLPQQPAARQGHQQAMDDALVQAELAAQRGGRPFVGPRERPQHRDGALNGLDFPGYDHRPLVSQ